MNGCRRRQSKGRANSREWRGSVRKGRKEGAVSRRGDNEKNPSTYKKGKGEVGRRR
jgi:hypothetical protein